MPSDKIAPAWDTIIACLPDSVVSPSENTPDDVLGVFGKRGLDCNPSRAQAYLLSDVGGRAYMEDESAHVIMDVAFPDIIPVAGQSSGNQDCKKNDDVCCMLCLCIHGAALAHVLLFQD